KTPSKNLAAFCIGRNQIGSLHSPPDVTPKSIELYDLQGRLVRSQRNGLESLNLQGLSAGQYVMKVTLENGKVFSDKVVKE
ncbi:MAG: T9SS type A sorting domain-containing protein, partial [Bacteroidales bacterium]|nr:T9SS type A sorting domain-containing protein [Bacteroidales bacterium]